MAEPREGEFMYLRCKIRQAGFVRRGDREWVVVEPMLPTKAPVFPDAEEFYIVPMESLVRPAEVVARARGK